MVMAFDKARVLLAASSVLALAACGSVPGQHAQAGAAPTRVHATPAGGSCGSPPPRYAWAVDVTLAAYVFNRWLYLLDPRTGRLRWQAQTFVTEGNIPLVTRTDVLALEGLQSVRLVDRNAADGRLIWQDTLTNPPVGGQPVTQAGPLALLPGGPRVPGTPAPLLAYGRASGRLAWRIDMPTFVSSPPVLAAGRILVQSADLIYACAATGSAAALRTGAGNTTADPA